MSGITLDIVVVFFSAALPIDQSKIKHTKKLKEIPSRHFLHHAIGHSRTHTHTQKTFQKKQARMPLYI